MPLIKQIYDATKAGHLIQPFTVQDLKNWIERMSIVKDDGDEYAPSSIEVILSNSNKKNVLTSNLNIKILKSRCNNGGKNEYWF